MVDIVTNRNCVYQTAYYAIWCPQYRRDVLRGTVADAVKVLKGVTARRLFQQFPTLKQRLWGGHLWSPSYDVGTAGNVSAATIRRYIERSEHVSKRR